MARQFGQVEKLPSGRWRARYITPDGQRVKAPETFDTAEQADKWLTVQRAAILTGTWQPDRPGQRTTLKTYATSWLASREDLKPRTVVLYEHLLASHVLPALGGHPLAELTPAIIRSWYAELGGSTGPTARAQSYRLLRAILNQAIRDGDLTSSPCTIRGAGTVTAPERTPPTIVQVEAIAAKMPARHRALVLVAAYGGLRLGELTALTRDDITVPDSDAKPVIVSVTKSMSRLRGRWVIGTPKTEAGRRRVALPASLTSTIRAHLADHVGEHGGSLVFSTAAGLPLARSNVSTMLHRAQRKAGVPESHFHDLRHAASTLALQSGATVKDTMNRLGHASPRAALIYQHSSQERDELIADALDQARQQATAGNVIPLKAAAR